MLERIHYINPGDSDWTKQQYLLGLGAYGWTVVLVNANSLDDAIDETIDWCVDNAPGLLCDDEVNEAYNEAIAQGASQEKAFEEAQVDCICGGNCGNYMRSDDLHILIEAPTVDELVEYWRRHR